MRVMVESKSDTLIRVKKIEKPLYDRNFRLYLTISNHDS
jgi:hypothetical protein